MQTQNKALCNATSFIPVTLKDFLDSGQWIHKNRPTVQQTSESHLWSKHLLHLPVNLITIRGLWRIMTSDTRRHRFVSCSSLRCYFLHTVKNWQLVDLKYPLYGLFRCCFYDLILKKTSYIMFHLLEHILSQHNLLAKIGVWRFHSTIHFFYLFSVRESKI